MRVYIIGTDGITLCRKASATVNDGEIDGIPRLALLIGRVRRRVSNHRHAMSSAQTWTTLCERATGGFFSQ
jgi:hypothetical protein